MAPPTETDVTRPPAAPAGREGSRLREVALLFTRLGFTAFGGPAVHTAMMEDEVVRRRGWIDRKHFLDLVASLNFIPGPNSTELAIHLGLIRAGYRGLVVAGVCFILPAVLIILPVAWAYVRFGRIPQVLGMLEAVNAAVVALLAVMCWRLARTAITDLFTATLGPTALLAAYAMRGRVPFQPELAILAAAALLGALRGRGLAGASTLPALGTLPLTAGAAAPAAAPAAPAAPATLLQLFLVFLKVGGTLFGSGYVLVTYLQTELVERRAWLTTPQLLDAVAVGQVTPGPLLTTATFIGYLLGSDATHGSPLGGLAGALIATAGIFLPSFLLVAVFGSAVLPRLRQNPTARGALDAMNAAVFALICFVTIELARHTLLDVRPFAFHPFNAALCAAAFVALAVFDVNATWVLLAAAGIGLARTAA